MTEPRDLDRLAARAFPATTEERIGGWTMRASHDLAAKRVNSALPLGAPLDVDAVERWYRERALDPLIMVTPEDELVGLDAELEQRGWSPEAPSDVLVGDPATVLDALEGPVHRVVPIEPESFRGTEEQVALGAAAGAGRATAVLQDGWTLLLGLDVAPGERRQGIAAALVRAWARLSEGRALYLQVERSNAAAQALYARAGFTRSHGYHYRRAGAGTRRA